MGLSTYSRHGVNYPMFTCDSCRQPIEDMRLAIITFPDLSGHPTSHSSGIYHKGQCDSDSGIKTYSDELSSYMQQLAWNCELGKKEVNGTKKRLVIEMPDHMMA